MQTSSLSQQYVTSSAAPAYLDATGHPRLRDSVVGFLDILGFSQAIKNSAELADAQLLVDKIVSAIEDSRQYVRESFAENSFAHPTSWAVKFFSDNLVVACPFDEKEMAPGSVARFIIRCSQRYQLRMVLNGFFIRGALTQGTISMTEDIIFGAGLLESYQLESKAAIVPRVIISTSLMRMFLPWLRDQVDQTDVANWICRDIDGWWFVNYLEAALKDKVVDWAIVERHKDCILESLASIKEHDVLTKYGWARRYHNMFCHWHRDAPGYSDSYRIDRADEGSTICRLSSATDVVW